MSKKAAIGDLARVRLDDGRIVFLGIQSSSSPASAAELQRRLRRARVGDRVSDGALEVEVCAADPYVTLADGSLLVEEMATTTIGGPRPPRRVCGDRTGSFVRLRWTQQPDHGEATPHEGDVEVGIAPLPEPLEVALSELDVDGGAVGGEWYDTNTTAGEGEGAPRLGGAFRMLPSPMLFREPSDDDDADADPSRWLSAAQSARDAGNSHASARRARRGLVVAGERCAPTSCGCLVLLSALAAQGVRPPPGEESSSDPAERLEHDAAAALLYAERAVRASEGLGAAPAARAAHLRLATQCMRAGLWDRAAAALRGAADRGGDPRGSIAAHLRRCSARAARDHARERRMAMRMLSQRAP